jgi:bacteriocin-like protein
MEHDEKNKPLKEDELNKISGGGARIEPDLKVMEDEPIIMDRGFSIW